MRIFSRFFRVSLKSALCSASVVFLLLGSLLSLAPIAFAEPDAEEELSLAIVNEDEGKLGTELVNALLAQESMRVIALTREQAMRMLASGKADVAAIIRPEYSARIGQAEFRNTVELFVSSASRATAAASEPVLNQTMLFYMEEIAVSRTRTFLQQQGLTLTPEREAALREEIRAVHHGGALAKAVAHIPEEESIIDKANPAQTALRYYAAFCVFYILVSAGWVADVSGTHLTLRIRLMGIPRAALLLSAGMAHAVLCLLFGVLAIYAGAMIGGGVIDPGLFLSLALYLSAAVGLAIVVATLARQATALFLVAPAVTFFNAALSGLLFPLPDWAALLTFASRALPGRQLALSLSSGNMKGLALCALCYLVAGLLLAQLVSGHEKAEKAERKKGEGHEDIIAESTV